MLRLEELCREGSAHGQSDEELMRAYGTGSCFANVHKAEIEVLLGVLQGDGAGTDRMYLGSQFLDMRSSSVGVRV